MIRYYSEVSKNDVTEPEAIAQIIELCNRWYQMAWPERNDFDQYFKAHPQLLDIEQWNCFRKTG